ncbi:type VII secretion protein EsaA [Priestia megaterium]|nr:type VII secretion protein EsaA [Priestia megaterium]
MTEQRRYTFKVILAVILILVFPSLFFQYIGDNPLKVTENATRTIAVVNEDIGVEEKGEEPIRFGRRVAEILDKDSEYEWTVLGRSAAANGLQSGKYDAVIYIPSDFSENILSYEEEKPEKATFQYKVQDQLNAVNKEKVVRELEDATTKVNNEMSSLYWSYVSQEVDKVRGQFDKILEKEIAFQNTMVAFYKPNSKDLAGEIDDQKKILEQIQGNVKSAQEGSTERRDDVQQVEQNLTNFIEDVDQYRAYQEAQKELLLKAQNKSVEEIQAGVSTISQQQTNNQDAFNNQASQVFGRLSTIQEQLSANSKAAGELNEAEQQQASAQQHALYALNKDLLSEYQQMTEQTTLNEVESQLAPLREKLQVASPVESESTEPTDSTEPTEPNEPNEPNETEPAVPDEGEENPSISVPVDLENQSGQLEQMVTDLNGWHGELEALPAEEQIPQVLDTKAKILDFISRIQTVNEQLKNVTVEVEQPESDADLQKENEELTTQVNELTAQKKQLEEQIIQLQEQIRQLEDENKQPDGSVQTAVTMIKEKENKIIGSNQLSETRKNRVMNMFASSIESTNMSDLLQYYGQLSQYELTLHQSSRTDVQESLLNNDSTMQRVQSIVYGSGDEQSADIRNRLQTNLASAKEELSEFEQSVQSFTEAYGQTIEGEQASIIEELSQIQERAGTMTETLHNSVDENMGKAPSQENPDVTALVTLQKSMGQELQGMNELISSLGERQTSVVEYTGELQEKVNEVQEKADSLNNKWAQNVDSTKLVRGQVYRLLNNTLVDGQNNEYVYDYLANPLQVSGEVPAEKVKTVPPVVLLVIILISSLLIGYFSHYYKNAPLLVRGSLFGLLVLIVGLMISVFSLNIYSLSGERAMEWSIFTIVLLLASSTIVRCAFLLGNFIGWVTTVVMILFFVTPLLSLSMPNFNYEDPVSKVYMSIQYETNSLFTEATMVLLGVTIMLAVIPFIVRTFTANKEVESDETYEA